VYEKVMKEATVHGHRATATTSHLMLQAAKK